MYVDSCNGCVPPERHVGCHGTCQKYIDSKAEYENNKAALKNARAADHMYREYHNKAVIRSMRKVGKYS